MKSQQTFGESCPDLFYCSLWKSPTSAKAKPVAREFTINAEYVMCFLPLHTARVQCSGIQLFLELYKSAATLKFLMLLPYPHAVVNWASNKENTFPCLVLSSGLSSYLLIDKYNGKIILFFMYLFKATLYLLFCSPSSQDGELSVLLQKQSGKCGLWYLTILSGKSEFLRLFRLVS